MGNRYGFHLAEIVECLDRSRACMIVIRDVPTARDLATRLETVRVVPVFVLADEETRRQRLERNGFDGGEVGIRLETDSNPIAHYDNHDDFYRELLENNGTVAAFELAIEALLDRYLLG
jgi:guanylate kinase